MDDGAEPAVEIRVRDEGEGMPASYRQLIFEKYGARRRAGRAAAAAAATAWVWCSAGARSAFTAAPSGSRTARGAGGCFCVRLPVARLPLSAAADPRSAPRAVLAAG